MTDPINTTDIERDIRQAKQDVDLHNDGALTNLNNLNESRKKLAYYKKVRELLKDGILQSMVAKKDNQLVEILERTFNDDLLKGVNVNPPHTQLTSIMKEGKIKNFFTGVRNENKDLTISYLSTLSEQYRDSEANEFEKQGQFENAIREEVGHLKGEAIFAIEGYENLSEAYVLLENENNGKTEQIGQLEQRIQELETQNGELEIRAGTPTRLPGIKPLSEKQKPKNDDKKSEPQKDGKSEKSPARKAAEYTMFGTMGLAAFGGLFLSAMNYFKDATSPADYQADSKRREAYFFQKAGQNGITDLSKIENEGNYQIVVAKEHINSANDFTVFVANEAITPLNDLILDAQHNDSKNNRLSYNSGKNSLPDRTAYEGKEAQTIIETIRNLDKNPNQISFEDVKLARQKMGKDGGINELIK